MILFSLSYRSFWISQDKKWWRQMKVNERNILVFRKEFFQLPSQAIKSKLANVKPKMVRLWFCRVILDKFCLPVLTAKKCQFLIDHSPFRQTFKLAKSTKHSLLDSSSLQFEFWLHFSAHNTKVYKICTLHRTIFSTFYNILQPNFTILLNLACSFQLC